MRVLAFPMLEQALHVLGLVTVAALVVLLLNLLLGASFPGFATALSPLLAAAAWAPLTWILYLPGLRGMRGESSP